MEIFLFVNYNNNSETDDYTSEREKKLNQNYWNIPRIYFSAQKKESQLFLFNKPKNV